ncbi:Phosphate metabolism transcription protein [Saccharomyces pastorianus]|uniref:Phosphate metabolism transcription protein n=1 Tax=Saccharomyces pastorianus TaxID=27292 RepID=A0A6C1E774_SACPS|nr:Phosphate metabolism transcription protein [Saccharomyces pastorianus]
MLFGVKLANEVYPPWKGSYIDYESLKKFLKEDSVKGGADDKKPSWDDSDESRFVEELDKELEKVYGFQLKKYKNLIERLTHLEKQTDSESAIKALDSDAFQRILEELLSESSELDNFKRLNFTGFVKIVKKHDKLHPKYPSVKSLLEVRLKELPSHSEEYSPLLYRISFLYNILRSNFNTMSQSLASASKFSSIASNDMDMNLKSFKFWVHNDNLMEVKTRILRHLPVLVYANVPSENDDLVNRFESDILNDDEIVASSSSSGSNAENGGLGARSFDPLINTLYFDNEHFEMYNNKLLKLNSAPTLRLRWTGQLSDKPDIFLEKKTLIEDETTGKSDFDFTKLQLKQKYINGFIFDGDKKFKDQTLKKLKDSGTSNRELEKLKEDFEDIQDFIIKDELQPVLRTVYTRTAFQIPGDDKVRITIDSNIVFIKEDSFDRKRPIRDPSTWHRTDIDANVTNPLKFLREGEYAKFPYSVMEIKVKGSLDSSVSSNSMISNVKLPKKHGQWLNDLTNSHLVKEIPKFSIFVQGVASLYGEDEKLDILPFWLPDLETDIRQDPKQAYEEEKKKLKKQKEIQKKIDGMRRFSNINEPQRQEPAPHEESQNTTSQGDLEADDGSSDEETQDQPQSKRSRQTRRRRPKATFLRILAGKDPKLMGVDSEEEEIELPPGVKKPSNLLKNAGPVNVEAKVWLANERTFNRWLSVTTLLSVLTFSIYNSVKKAEYPNLANYMAYVYFALTLFCALWSYSVYMKRVNIIQQRSGQHLDAPLGPVLVAIVLFVTLVVNFVMAFRNAARSREELLIQNLEVPERIPEVLRPIQDYLFRLMGPSKK